MTGVSPVEPNEWTHLSFTYSQTDIVVYVNGIADASMRITEELGVFLGDAGLGSWTRNGDGTRVERESNAQMEDVLIYDRALSAEEILFLSQL